MNKIKCSLIQWWELNDDNLTKFIQSNKIWELRQDEYQK
jgi:hypothetical protein